MQLGGNTGVYTAQSSVCMHSLNEGNVHTDALPFEIGAGRHAAHANTDTYTTMTMAKTVRIL